MSSPAGSSHEHSVATLSKSGARSGPGGSRPGRELLLVTALVSALVSALATGCGNGDGDLGGYRPDMTWGPASNTLYSPGGNWAQRFCEHVHVVCQDEPGAYEYCLMDWTFYQQVCPLETEAVLSCFDTLYECGRYEDWDWWGLVEQACASQYDTFFVCIEPYLQWD
ncbi:MAG: hypothetical protein ABI333_25635 [bacterium]